MTDHFFVFVVAVGAVEDARHFVVVAVMVLKGVVAAVASYLVNQLYLPLLPRAMAYQFVVALVATVVALAAAVASPVVALVATVVALAAAVAELFVLPAAAALADYFVILAVLRFLQYLVALQG